MGVEAWGLPFGGKVSLWKAFRALCQIFQKNLETGRTHPPLSDYAWILRTSAPPPLPGFFHWNPQAPRVETPTAVSPNPYHPESKPLVAPPVQTPGDKTKFCQFGWFPDPSDQNELYHTPSYPKIWDFTKERQNCELSLWSPLKKLKSNVISAGNGAQVDLPKTGMQLLKSCDF